MKTTDAQKRASTKWLSEKVENVTGRVPIGKKAVLQEHAKAHGESLNAFLYRAANETMERDKQK